MGLYNIINYVCPHCGKPTHTQTKVLGKLNMITYNLGDSINHEDTLIRLKNPCEHCMEFSAIRIKNREIVEIIKDATKANKREIEWAGIVSNSPHWDKLIR